MISYKKIEAKANLLLKKTGINSAPIEIERIAEYLGVDIKYDDLDDDVSGFLSVDPDHAVAVINSEHHPNRQRFTIAHELGHFVLHVKSNEGLFIDKKYAVHHRDSKSSLGTVDTEREANLFASALLMPRSLVRELLEDYQVDFLDEIETHSFARKLGVSEQALGFRLARLNYEVGE
jgi:Zn-dependent peptidase ImmA (M78 family)